jgi:hypothetical protein
VERRGDLRVGPPGGDQVQHVPLAGGQPEERGRRAGRAGGAVFGAPVVIPAAAAFSG